MTARVDFGVVIDLLTHARATIATKAWTKGGPARDASDRFVWESDPRAVKFSTLGALMLAARHFGVGWVDATTAAAVRAMQVVTVGESRPRDVACLDVAEWSDALPDDDGRAQVIERFTAAIAHVTSKMPRRTRPAVAAEGEG